MLNMLNVEGFNLVGEDIRMGGCWINYSCI